jgi:hypothetical protein
MRKGDEVQYQNAEWAEADRKIVGRALRIAAKDIKRLPAGSVCVSSSSRRRARLLVPTSVRTSITRSPDFSS